MLLAHVQSTLQQNFLLECASVIYTEVWSHWTISTIFFALSLRQSFLPSSNLSCSGILLNKAWKSAFRFSLALLLPRRVFSVRVDVFLPMIDLVSVLTVAVLEKLDRRDRGMRRAVGASITSVEEEVVVVVVAIKNEKYKKECLYIWKAYNINVKV